MQGVNGNGWGKVPLVSLKNNSEERTDLIPIKPYIDALDIVSSGFINDLKDIQLAIWVLRGYEGEDLGEFMLNLQKFKAISLSTDENSNAEPKTLEIPKEARSALMEWLEGKIYEVGQGVNQAKLSGGSLTNVAIKAMYTGLDMKSDQLITKMKASLSEFMYFVVKFINDRDNTNYDYKTIKFVFDKSRIFNTKEIIEYLVLLEGKLSKETLLANNPLVSNVKEELERLEEEQKKQMALFDDNQDFEE